MHVVTIAKDPVLKSWYVMVIDNMATNAKVMSAVMSQ